MDCLINKIVGLLDKSDYEGYWDFINYCIDGYWLDEKIDKLYPNNMYKGLIPTLVYWMEIETEKALVWKRILPEENQTTICPILMCPYDNDFSCTLIVAEIRNCGNTIQWKRVGVDQTKEWEPEVVGKSVQWLDKIEELNFDRKDYLLMLANFKDRLVFDEIRIKEWLKKKS
nr:hypothetical protein [uncultured Pedobacter sp.]